jgi:hypothetical protein
LEIVSANETEAQIMPCQNIVVFQQNKRGESKIQGIKEYGGGRFDIKIISINESLPPVLDETDDFLPRDIRADLVLDFLAHPDLSQDLAGICVSKGIPIVASGKKNLIKGVHTPPT